MLSDESIRALRPGTKPQKLFDEKGLFLLVAPTGSRLWRFKYYYPAGLRTTRGKGGAMGRNLPLGTPLFDQRS